MGAGRPGKSEAAKALAGTLKPSQVGRPKSEPKTKVAVTDAEPPAYLNDKGKMAFYALVKHLKKAESFWAIDVQLIGKAAFWMQLWEEAVMDVIGNTVQTFPNGSQQISPQLQVLDKAETHVKKYYELLGIGPKAREALVAFQTNGSSEEQDPFALLLRELDPIELPQVEEE